MVGWRIVVDVSCFARERLWLCAVLVSVIFVLSFERARWNSGFAQSREVVRCDGCMFDEDGSFARGRS